MREYRQGHGKKLDLRAQHDMMTDASVKMSKKTVGEKALEDAQESDVTLEGNHEAYAKLKAY